MVVSEIPRVPRIKETIKAIYTRNKNISSKTINTRGLREVQIYFLGSGGGSSVGQWLLGVSGASSTILGVEYPYHRAALSEAIGGPPVHGFCSVETSLTMGRRARDKGKSILANDIGFDIFPHYDISKQDKRDPPLVLGVGFSAVLATDKPHKGEHRGFIGVCDNEGREIAHKILMKKGYRTRQQEDELTSYLIIHAITEYVNKYASAESLESGNMIQLPVEHIHDFGGVEYETLAISNDPFESKMSAIDSVINGVQQYALFWPKKVGDNKDAEAVYVPHIPVQTLKDSGRSLLIFSGSFNPLHKGHEELAIAAQKKCIQAAGGKERRLIFELSVHNADKGDVTIDVVAERMLQFTSRRGAIHGPWPVVATKVPKFIEKAKLFPGCVFVVGMDTAVRIIDPKYYNHSQEEMLEAMLQIKSLSCSFVVAGRLNKSNNKFETFHSTINDISPVLQSMFVALSEEEFRIDISSTELRQRM